MKKADRTGTPSLPIYMYCGQMILTGRVAPASWWRSVLVQKAQEQRDDALKRVGRRDAVAKSDVINDEFNLILNELEVSVDTDLNRQADEVTLYDACAAPAISVQGSQSGSVRFPVARVPLSSINTWWMMEGTSSGGRQGLQFGVGMILPISL